MGYGLPIPMNQLQLYINDQLVDLADDSPIALTFQINNLAEVKNQQGNTSNQFKLPLTQHNRQVLGFPDDITLVGIQPYDYYPAKIIQDGLEIVPYGMALLNSVDNDTAAITVLSGNVDFFDALDVKIYDLGDNNTTAGKQKIFEKYNHTWNLENIVYSQTHSEGWIWPVVDYGKMAMDANNPTIDVRYLRPGFFLKTAIELFVKQAGYKINPSSFLLKQPMYEKLIVQFAADSFQHGTDYQKSRNASGLLATLGADIRKDHPNVNTPNQGLINFINVDNNVDNYYNAATGIYTASSISKVNIKLTIPGFYLFGNMKKLNDYSSCVDIKIQSVDPRHGVLDLATYRYGLDGGIRISAFTSFGYKTFKDEVQLTADAFLEQGDQLRVIYSFEGYSGSFFTMPASTQLNIVAENQEVLYGQQVQCERIFPDITQKDLLKDTLQRFGIICQADNTSRTITFSSFRDIVNNIPKALNWTDKCLDQGKSISFQLGNYAQVNNLLYKEDDGIFPPKFGNSAIRIADKTLTQSADLFESQFAPTLNRPYFNGYIAQILKIDPKDDAEQPAFSISTQPRLLINEQYALQNSPTAKRITFTDGHNSMVVNDTLSVPYFYKPNAEHSLLWEDLRLKYYPELEKILQQTKKVERYFMLSPRDILELDLLLPIYLEQDGAYYYINKIDSWRKGQPVKVELVKLG
ncbi:MAG: hypothetical protein C0154_09830 [Mucilaginibacter sp.]|nr:MAG: hypothetical protein BGO48_01905 [Mucilaginibacter sp. 44-25]PLW89781.1 MAG: hypothetical protein C0154_09830 [Mucilaginibacter sp.]